MALAFYQLQAALERGTRDFHEGEPREHNPYENATLRVAWEEGWDEGLLEDNEASARNEENYLRVYA